MIIPEIIQFFRREAKTNGLKIFATSSLSGIANASTIVIVNAAAHNYAQMNVRYIVLFTLSVAIYIITFKYAMSQAAAEVQGIISNINIKFADKIRQADLRSFEKIDTNRIYTTLSENNDIIFEAARLIVNCSSSIVMLIFSSIYLAIISKTAFWIAAGLILCSAIGYLHNQKGIEKQLAFAGAIQTEFFNALDHLLGGFMEVKMSKNRSRDIFANYLVKTSVRLKEIKLKIEANFLSNQILAQTYWFILIASIVFLLPQLTNTPPEQVLSITMIVLFILGPIATIIASIPIIVKANFAVIKLKELEKALDASEDFQVTTPTSPFKSESGLQLIEIKNLQFTYDKPLRSSGFSIGPIDMSIKANEILFIVGGNGSGKTTLLKQLAGLYYPDSGGIFFNGMAVNASNYEHYRNTMSIIFTEFHLFDRLYGQEMIDKDKLQSLLQTMNIYDKTAYIDGAFTNTDLSTGQKKRLALVNVLMEDRDILIFDELAADQDPEFRKYFYEVLLKELQSQGKTIVCTSHDDRYFHVADRLIKMEYGKILDEN